MRAGIIKLEYCAPALIYKYCHYKNHDLLIRFIGEMDLSKAIKIIY